MKTIKVFGFSSHQTKERTSGVDFVRIIQPLKFLNGYQDDEVKIEVEMHDIFAEPEKSWLEIAKEFDIVYMNYTVLDWNYAAMGCFVHGEGKKIIYDIDDAIWHLRKDNVTYDQMKEIDGAYNITCMLNDVDYVTTTNRYLRNVLLNETTKPHSKIKVMPNMVDLSLYNKTFPAVERDTITLLHYGSNSHFQDLLDKNFVEGIDRIFARYPNVKIKFIGAFIQELKYKWGARCETAFGDTDIYKWIEDKFPQFMEEADIIVAPLEDDKYNRSKSDIKAIESWSAMKPFVCSSVRPYIDIVEEGVTGYTCRTSDDWYNSLSTLIESTEKRKEIGTNGYNYVVENRQIQNNLAPYVNLMKEATRT